MFGLSFSHLILLAVIALVFIGPKQLPEVARVLGRFINDLKRTSGEITKSFAEMRDNQNQAIIHSEQNAPPPIVPHEPSAVSPGHDGHDDSGHRDYAQQTTLGDQALGEPRNFNATGASPSQERALDEQHQMSFVMPIEKSGHGEG